MYVCVLLGGGVERKRELYSLDISQLLIMIMVLIRASVAQEIRLFCGLLNKPESSPSHSSTRSVTHSIARLLVLANRTDRSVKQGQA